MSNYPHQFEYRKLGQTVLKNLHEYSSRPLEFLQLQLFYQNARTSAENLGLLDPPEPADERQPDEEGRDALAEAELNQAGLDCDEPERE